MMVRSRFTDHKCKRRRGEKPRWDKDFWRKVIEHQVVPAAVTIETGDRIWRSQDATALSSQAFWSESLSTLWQVVRSNRLWIFFAARGGASNAFQSVYRNAAKERFEIAALPGRDCGRRLMQEPHKDSPQPSGSEMAGASASVSTAPPGSGNRIPACPFLTALQIPLQPLPQPRCRNERSRISRSSCSSSPHCQSGMNLETRRMGAPLVRSPGGVRTCLSACRGEGLGA